jgi:hypothetical protein
MEYYTKRVRVGEAEGLQVWCTSHGYSRPADGEKVYPSRQNAYVARDRLQESTSWQDCLVNIRVDMKDFQHVVDHIERCFRGTEVLVCLPYKDSMFEKRKEHVVDVQFRYMCRPPQVQLPDVRHWQQTPMTRDELAVWLKELDATFPVVQNSSID